MAKQRELSTDADLAHDLEIVLLTAALVDNDRRAIKRAMKRLRQLAAED